jgi:hypothetical protein
MNWDELEKIAKIAIQDNRTIHVAELANYLLKAARMGKVLEKAVFERD